MNIVKTAAAIFFAASVNAFSFDGTDLNGQIQDLNGVFDAVKGGAGVTHFVPEAADQPEIVPVAAKMVMADIKVPLVPNSRAFLEIQLNKLEKVYGFKLDETFQPQLHNGDNDARSILGETTYLVRGVITSDKLDAFTKDSVVKAVYADMPVQHFAQGVGDGKALQGFVDAHEFDFLKIKGVKGVVVGVDCPIKGPHQHVMPHHPAIVIYFIGDDAAVRAAVVKALPQLSELPFRLAPQSEAVEAAQVHCLIPEGCAR